MPDYTSYASSGRFASDRDIIVDIPPDDCHSPQEDSRNCVSQSFLSRLRPVVRWLLLLPFLRDLRGFAGRIKGVMEPAGRLFVRHQEVEKNDQPCRPLTLISANLWHDWPQYRDIKERLEAFAQLAEEHTADIILLQEVARTRQLKVDQWLAERLGMAYVYSRVNGHEGGIGFEEGLAVFSRFPIRDLHLNQLGGKKTSFARRLALGATLETPCGKLLVVSVHLGIPRQENASQIACLRSWVEKITASGREASALPAIVGGDFNTHENTPQIVQAKASWMDTFRQLHPHADGTTHEIHWPSLPILRVRARRKKTLRRSRLDYIFLQPGGIDWQILDAAHLTGKDRPHSDHRAALARIQPIIA